MTLITHVMSVEPVMTDFKIGDKVRLSKEYFSNPSTCDPEVSASIDDNKIHTITRKTSDSTWGLSDQHCWYSNRMLEQVKNLRDVLE